MRFRPCIDIHDGKVKQIVGGSLREKAEGISSGQEPSSGWSSSPDRMISADQGLNPVGGSRMRSDVRENFVSELGADFYAELYRDRGLTGGHVILLNGDRTPGYEASRKQAFMALSAFPGGLQAGGGINPRNAADYLDAGASHVIVTSYVFRDGKVDTDRLEEMRRAAGRERLVLDLSCRLREGQYYIVTDRWQKFTETQVTLETIQQLGEYCDEFLVHAVDVEGKAKGIETDLARILGQVRDHAVTYAGGIGSMADLDLLRDCTDGRVDFTIGSALDLFGGNIPFEQAAAYHG